MSELLDKVNAATDVVFEGAEAPVLATPAAFVAGVVAGAKAPCIIVAAAAAGAAVRNAAR